MYIQGLLATGRALLESFEHTRGWLGGGKVRVDGRQGKRQQVGMWVGEADRWDLSVYLPIPASDQDLGFMNDWATIP